MTKAEKARYDVEYKSRNQERLTRQAKEYYQRNKGRIRKQTAEYRAANREKNREYQRKYYARYKDDPECKARRKAYADAHNADYYARVKDDPWSKEQRSDILHRRRARQRGAFRERVYRRKVWERDEGICGICGKLADPQDWHLDHVVPLGPGEHSYDNVQVSHPRCNAQKSAADKRILAEWMEGLS